MKRTMYRIRYKISDSGNEYAGIRIVPEPIDEYIKTLRKSHSAASVIYMELEDVIEEDDDSATSMESIILLGH